MRRPPEHSHGQSCGRPADDRVQIHERAARREFHPDGTLAAEEMRERRIGPPTVFLPPARGPSLLEELGELVAQLGGFVSRVVGAFLRLSGALLAAVVGHEAAVGAGYEGLLGVALMLLLLSIARAAIGGGESA